MGLVTADVNALAGDPDASERMAPAVAAEHRAEIKLRIAFWCVVFVAILVVAVACLFHGSFALGFSAFCVFQLLTVSERIRDIRHELRAFDIEYPEAKTTPWHPH